MSEKTGCNQWLPRASGNMYLRVDNRPITAWHSDSTTQRTHIRVMMTATRQAGPTKAMFSTRDPVHKGPRQSTQKRTTLPGSLAPHPGRWSKATPAYTVRRDKTTHVRRPCTRACQLQHVGRYRGQRSPSTSSPMGGSVTTKLVGQASGIS
jgi:hypothetical protein